MTSVILAGGGTAGHVSPLLAVAEALNGRCAITCVGTSGGLEASLVPAAGLDLRLIDATWLPRSLTLDLVKLPWRVLRAVRQATRIIDDVKPGVVVGFGGYVSMPVYLAARRRRVPIVMHEQNALPGLANRLMARRAAACLTTFPGTPLPGAECVGLPVRGALAALAEDGRESRRVSSRKALGLPETGPVLLVSGGSLGAKTLNDATRGARDQLLASGVSVVHVWGRQNFPDAAAVIKAGAARYVPLSYVDDMAEVYAAADLMLARAGAATVAETAMVGLPCLFVPFPYGNGEQRLNTAPLVEAGAGLQIDNGDLTPARLLEVALPLLADNARLQSMGEAARTLMLPGASERVADIALRLAGASTGDAA